MFQRTRRQPKYFISWQLAALALLAAALSLFATSSIQAHDDPVPAITPESVAADLEPGGELVIDKTVHTPAIPPKADVYILADTTGSMGGVIAAVQAGASSIIGALPGDVQYGAGNYKDFPFDLYAFSNDAPIGPDDGLGGAPDASDAIAAWAAGGGADGSEGQLFALDQIADVGDPQGINWRPGASRIVVWFGDAPGHDPVCSAISGLGYDITEASATAKLAGNITVVAISTLTGFPAGLDDDPTSSAGDYSGTCAIGGAAGQATRIAAATGGVHLTGIAPADIIDAILDGIAEVEIEVSMVSDCDTQTGGVITTTFAPASQTVTSGDHALFTETVSVAGDAEPGTYECDDWALIDGNPMVGADGAIIKEHKTITVLDVIPPVAECVESVNPNGNVTPPAGSTTLPGSKGGQNEDGYYQLLASDNFSEADALQLFVMDTGSGTVFGPFAVGTVIKYTEDSDAIPESKKIGSDKGQAGAVEAHIIGNGDAALFAVDEAGNVSARVLCLVPEPPK